MNIKNLILGIGIVVIFGLALWQGIETFYPSPQSDSYCNETMIPIPVDKGMDMSNNATYCAEHDGLWRDGFCDLYYNCRMEYEEALKPHSQVVFIISLIVAVIAIIIGYFLIKIEPVGSSLIGCGIWAIFWGSVINWRNFANYARFILLSLALVFVIWLALRLNRKKKKR